LHGQLIPIWLFSSCSFFSILYDNGIAIIYIYIYSFEANEDFSSLTIVTQGTGHETLQVSKAKTKALQFMLFYDRAQSFVLRSHTMAE